MAKHNFFDYLYWRGDLSFSEDGFNEVDNLILTEIAYMDFNTYVRQFPSKKKTTLQSATLNLFEDKNIKEMTLGVIVPNSIISLTKECGNTRRFGNIRLSNYTNTINEETVEQFSAMCFHIDKNIIYISFRGTDDTLIGWHENLQLINKFPVEAQTKAAEYINKIAEMYPTCKLIIGGHSKGGNLSVFGATYCNDNIKDRIIHVYSNDGTGFFKDTFDLKRFELIKDKTTKIIPQDSIVGLLFENITGETIVVKSNTSGLREHDAFSWDVKRNYFTRVKKPSDKAIGFSNDVKEFVYSLTEEEKQELILDMYDFITQLDTQTLLNSQINFLKVLHKLHIIDKHSREIFVAFLKITIKHNILL